MNTSYPTLMQVNTRALLAERGAALGRPATLDDVPDAALDQLADDGFDWVWLLGVWQTGKAGRRVSLNQPEWQAEYRHALPDFTADDVCGSPFAISEHAVHRDFGGADTLARLRARLASRGIKLMLDFVPNHTAPDHAWARRHPEFYIQGSADDLAREPYNYVRLDTDDGPHVFAHGRDPYFPGWPDTVQLNYRHPKFRDAMIDALLRTAAQCDGVRCDMAMLVLPDVFARTWGDRSHPGDGSRPVDDSFWPTAIGMVRERRPDFTFMAEAYWDLEWRLQQEGFDYTYDKRLYDRLHAQDAGSVRGHLCADLAYQRRSARFLENHDEPRAAAAFEPAVHQAAAVLTLLAPGLRFVHDGQREGRRIRASNHLRRRAPEPVDAALDAFYRRLLACVRRPETRVGEWTLLERRPAWDGNPTWERFIAYRWQHGAGRLIVVANYGDSQGQGYVEVGDVGEGAGDVVLRDLMTPSITYSRARADLARHGLYLDMPAWAYHVFEVTAP